VKPLSPIRYRTACPGDPFFEEKMGCPDKPGNDQKV
jgi:hypothetical protein